MLTPQYLQEQPQHIVDIFLKLEEDIIADIARRISQNLKLTETAEYQIEMLYRMGYNIDDIEAQIAKTLKLTEKELDKILNDAAQTSYENDRAIYKKGGKILPELNKNPKMVDFIQATVAQTKGSLRNLSNTMGFMDGGVLKPIGTFYRDSVDYAVFQLASGAFDYNTILKRTVKKLGDSGLRTVDYASGRKYHIESAVRMNILTAMTQITGYMSLANADLVGQDLMEITAHMGARPSHAEWQGQIVSRSSRPGYLSLEDIGYDTVEGFKGANCRHDWFPFFEGISKPTYTKEQLENIDPPDFEYEGRTYTAYEASQKQRQIERRMRSTKREIIAYEAAGLEDDVIIAKVKLKRQRDFYIDFSKAAGLRPKHERTYTYGYGRSQSMRAV